jgi:hypothetical protein
MILLYSALFGDRSVAYDKFILSLAVLSELGIIERDGVCGYRTTDVRANLGESVIFKAAGGIAER